MRHHHFLTIYWCGATLSNSCAESGFPSCSEVRVLSEFVLQRCIFFMRATSLSGKRIWIMIYSQLSSDLWAVRLEDGDDILVSLRRFVEVKGVRAGLLEGIGSLGKVRVGCYDFGKRKYSWQGFEE